MDLVSWETASSKLFDSSQSACLTSSPTPNKTRWNPCSSTTDQSLWKEHPQSPLCCWRKSGKVLQTSQMPSSSSTVLRSGWLSRSSHFVSTRNSGTRTKTLTFCLCLWLRIHYWKCCAGRSSWWVQSGTHRWGWDWQNWLSEAPTPESDCWGVSRTWRTSKTSSVSWIKWQVPTVCKHHQTHQIESRF